MVEDVENILNRVITAGVIGWNTNAHFLENEVSRETIMLIYPLEGFYLGRARGFLDHLEGFGGLRKVPSMRVVNKGVDTTIGKDFITVRLQIGGLI